MSTFSPRFLEPWDVINCAGTLVDLSTPKAMGILNVTPDSFYDGGKWSSLDAAYHQMELMIKAGATFIDVGAMSSRPGAVILRSEEEIERLQPYEGIFKEVAHRVILSIDTIHSQTAAYALDIGFKMINDISAGTFDPEILSLAGDKKVPYVAMHMKGTPQEMQKDPTYEDVTLEVIHYMVDRIKACREADIYDVILDPGFGFGKTIEQNYTLLDEMKAFEILELPILVGLSRKSMLYKPLGIRPEEALPATAAIHMLALERGAKIIRAHDVQECVQVINLHAQLPSEKIKKD